MGAPQSCSQGNHGPEDGGLPTAVSLRAGALLLIVAGREGVVHQLEEHELRDAVGELLQLGADLRREHGILLVQGVPEPLGDLLEGVQAGDAQGLLLSRDRCHLLRRVGVAHVALQALLGARLAQLARSQFHRSAAGKGHELPGWLGVQAPHEVRVEERPVQTGHDGSRESPGQKLAGGLQHRRDADQVAKGLDHVGLQLVVESPVRPHPQVAVAVGLALEELHGLARARRSPETNHAGLGRGRGSKNKN